MFAATRDEVIPRKKLQSALEKLCWRFSSAALS
jgi:hypothetical protein